MRMQVRSNLGLGAAFVLFVGCAGGGQNLKPAQAANQVAGMEHAAKAMDNQVEVIAQTREWPGNAQILEEVEAVRVRITNRSREPVQIRYGNIRLVSSDGATFRAIPPLAVTGEVTATQRVVNDPLFVHSGYMIAPYYVGTYPGLTPYDGTFVHDPGYYGLYDQYWTTEELPTAEMIAWSLPEGVLQPGGFVDGYVYFERVPDDKQQVRLETVLTAEEQQREDQRQQQAQASAEQPHQPMQSDEQPSASSAPATQSTSSEQIASVSIPFTVE